MPPPVDLLQAQRAPLLSRIEALSHDQCDAVTLRLELVPQEKILDPDSNPKKLLLRYTRQATTREELESIERTINDEKRHRKIPPSP